MPEWGIALLTLGGAVGSFIMLDIWIHKADDNYDLKTREAVKDIEKLLAGLEFNYHNSEHYKKTQAMKRYKEKRHG